MPISTAVCGVSTETPVGPANGLDHDIGVSRDNIDTVPVDALARQLGLLLADRPTRRA